MIEIVNVKIKSNFKIIIAKIVSLSIYELKTVSGKELNKDLILPSGNNFVYNRLYLEVLCLQTKKKRRKSSLVPLSVFLYKIIFSVIYLIVTNRNFHSVQQCLEGKLEQFLSLQLYFEFEFFGGLILTVGNKTHLKTR